MIGFFRFLWFLSDSVEISHFWHRNRKFSEKTFLFSRFRHLKHLTEHGYENRNFSGLFANSRGGAPLPFRNYDNPPLKRLCVITVKLAAIGKRGVAEDEIKGRHLETSKMKTLKNVENVNVEYFHCCGLSTSTALLNTCHILVIILN